MCKTIFVVDDNGTNLTIAEAMLEKEYSVITLSSAERMFAILDKIRPDLILLDIEMPGMNGYDALRLLKADGAYANIPVIFLTALAVSDIEAKIIGLGAADYIIKPFSKADLLNIVKKYL